MADWVRNVVMLTGMGMWAIFIAVNLLRGDEVNVVVIFGFPGALYFALDPSFKKKGGKDGKR